MVGAGTLQVIEMLGATIAGLQAELEQERAMRAIVEERVELLLKRFDPSDGVVQPGAGTA